MQNASSYKTSVWAIALALWTVAACSDASTSVDDDRGQVSEDDDSVDDDSVDDDSADADDADDADDDDEVDSGRPDGKRADAAAPKPPLDGGKANGRDASANTDRDGTTVDEASDAGVEDGSARDAARSDGGDSEPDASVDEGETCALPSTFKWTSGGPIAQPKNGWVAIKDFTHVLWNGTHIVYMTTHDRSRWGAALMTFKDWPDAASAPQTKVDFGVAPTLFYFTPKKLWILAYQWGPHKFSYRTSTDPTNPTGWSMARSLYNTALPPNGTGPIDQTVICDDARCWLYYAGDNGHIYKSSLPIDSFPGEFPAAKDSGIVGTTQNLFEGVQVYSIKGSNKYLMIVEAQGSGRYFRAWTATNLDGPWTLLTDNFAIKSNVSFSQQWTNDISHGDLVRNNPDETFTIDPCNLQMVFQGRDPNVKTSYELLPYRLGLLTLVR